MVKPNGGHAVSGPIRPSSLTVRALARDRACRFHAIEYRCARKDRDDPRRIIYRFASGAD